jgi:hypothetical protein
MSVTATHRIFTPSVGSDHPLYLGKVERKGRTKDELDAVISWLAGYDESELTRHRSTGPRSPTFSRGRGCTPTPR